MFVTVYFVPIQGPVQLSMFDTGIRELEELCFHLIKQIGASSKKPFYIDGGGGESKQSPGIPACEIHAYYQLELNDAFW